MVPVGTPTLGRIFNVIVNQQGDVSYDVKPPIHRGSSIY
jgi:hypothetical protein